MRYYLDTVAVRTLSKELPKLRNNSFTSALVILELISGLSEREYTIRKQVIKNLLINRFPIVWKLPETIKAEAFPIIEINESRTHGLLKICFELIRSENLETLILNTKNETYNIDFFKELDKTYYTGFIDATLKGNEDLKKIYSEIRSTEGKIYENIAKQFVKSLEKEYETNNGFTLNAIANHLSIFASKNSDYVSDEELRKCYNHSIDIFLQVFSSFSAKKSGELGTPAKNDYIDLNHLLYLGNKPNLYIVTNDKMILNNTVQSKTIEDYKSINGIR